MKQCILIGFLTVLLAATTPLRAQIAPRDSDARKGSRLELGRTAVSRKATSPAMPAQRFSLVTAPAYQSLDRPNILRKNTPINEYYRSLLVARPTTKAASRPAATEETPAAVSELRSGAEPELKAEDHMYTSERITVSNIYPNPASEAAEIDYQISGPIGEAKLILLNVLGSPVAEYELERNERKVRIVTRDLATGYYFYQLSLDGKKVATKKLLVRHQ
ncbi:T9SS type A sorting domain-containing protein [Spirosoma taeanense]|uniref:T9SS type A sorting domain-containing protein n=1 Tax=Spirosoma taeanense TaxID=2735870 RepID=A0A6M5Y855_9BACT|nr:T9SS type A sorting domain-containing protein [Spirosoma taeanense]QJW90069.1 T9SS type A sorting domain-containing protein [Spirosoma taeanense]